MQEDPEEGIGDVDLFTLQDDKLSLTVNAKWLQHLQVSLHHASHHFRHTRI